MRKFLHAAAAAAVAALTLGPLAANAATTNFAIVFSEAPSASVSCTPVTGLTVPVAAGTQVATCTVAPSSWTGSLGLSGTGASAFVVGGTAPNFTVSVGASAYDTVGTVNLTATSTP